MQSSYALHLLKSICFFLILTSTSAAQDFQTQLSEKLLAYRSTLPQEKAYLHLDKPYYASGDTLYFSAYLVEAALHRADSASLLLYVDLVFKPNGKIMASRKVALNGGTGYGTITLADSLQPGAYTIRAYTHWMRNAPTDFFFQRDLYLFDKQTNTPEPESPDLADLQFFPESGTFVGGQNTRVAFKGIDQNGRGVDLEGFLLNSKKDTVMLFKSAHLGMGKFQFMPQPSETYSGFARAPGGSFQPFPFPKVEPEGFTMVVDNVSRPAQIRVIIYHKGQAKKERPVYLSGHCRGILAFGAKGNVADRGLILNIPTSELPEGITALTLFDENSKPVAERLVFISRDQSLRVQIKTTPNPQPRKPVTVDLLVTDTLGKPVKANLSVAVTDAGQIEEQPYDMNMVNYLFLSSDLKGYIEQPAYYFDTTKSERKILLENLLMTQGWRRFKWEEVFVDSVPRPKYLIEQGISLRGEVKKGNRAVTEKQQISVFLSTDSLQTFVNAESDAAGRFQVDNIVFYDSLQVRLQGMNKKGNMNLNFRIIPWEAPRPVVPFAGYYPVIKEPVDTYLENARQAHEIERKIRAAREKLLETVTIKAKKPVERDTRKLYNHADATIKMTPQMAIGSMTVLDILAGRVAGVRVIGSGMNAQVSIRNGGRPLFLLDGIQVDQDAITAINVNDVESIDVLKGVGSAIYGSQGGNGVISVLTKRGNVNYDYTKEEVPGTLVTKITGYDTPREFYAPAYDNPLANDGTPDRRSTLFWVPHLKTDANGKASFTYYHSDEKTTVQIKAEVLAPSGAPGFGVTRYSVR